MLATAHASLVGGLAIAEVGDDRWLRIVWPLLLTMILVSAVIIRLAAKLE